MANHVSVARDPMTMEVTRRPHTNLSLFDGGGRVCVSGVSATFTTVFALQVCSRSRNPKPDVIGMV